MMNIQKLNQNNWIDIVWYLSYQEIFRLFQTCTFWKPNLFPLNEVWKVVYLSLLYQSYLFILEKDNHGFQADNYLSQHFSERDIHGMIYVDLKLFLEKRLFWKDYYLRVKRLVYYLSQCVSKEKFNQSREMHNIRPDCIFNMVDIPLQQNLQVRAGHALHHLSVPEVEKDFLVLINGYTVSYREEHTIETVSLTDFSVGARTPLESIIPTCWYHGSFVIGNILYYFGGDRSARHISDPPESTTVFGFQISPTGESLLGNIPIICEGSNDILIKLRASYAGSVVVDPFPIENTKIRRVFYFGGETLNDNRYQNHVIMLLIDESAPYLVQIFELDVHGDIPCCRSFHASQLIGREMYVFSGFTKSHPEQVNNLSLLVSGQYFFNDLYSFSLDTFEWKQVQTFGIPPLPRSQMNVFTIPDFYDLFSTQSSLSQEEKDVIIDNFSPKTGFEGSKYLIMYGGATLDSTYDGTHVDYGRRVFDLGDFHILDLETNMWLPCNLVNDRFRGGCLGFTFYESKAEYANRILPRKGWIFSGGLFSLPGWNVPEFRNDLCIIPLASYPK